MTMTTTRKEVNPHALWRRGAEPVAAGPHDYGTYGPNSVAWKILCHPVVSVMTVQLTAFLQFTHAGMSANMLDHDPLFQAAKCKRATPDMIVSRHRRTIGVPFPAIMGDQPSAERIFAHLRRIHSKMQGIIPGTDIAYDAAGPELVLFGHVTLMHGVLLSYERAGYGGLHAPRRLSDAERDQFWAEVVPFAVMMGANEADVPRSTSEVQAFYAACEADYFNFDLMLAATLRTFGDALRPARWRHPVTALTAAILALSHIPALCMLPRPARRHAGVPPSMDAALDIIFRTIRPVYMLLSIGAIGDTAIAWTVGPDGTALIMNARKLRTAEGSQTDP